MKGLAELLAFPVELIARGGKPAGAAAIAVGLGLVAAGLWLCFGLLGPGSYWPIMLSVSGLGLALAGAGLATFVGSQAKMAAFDVEAMTAPVSSVPIDSATIPFWVCGACKIVVEGVSMTERCEQCASIIDYMPVETEADRKLARGLLS